MRGRPQMQETSGRDPSPPSLSGPRDPCPPRGGEVAQAGRVWRGAASEKAAGAPGGADELHCAPLRSPVSSQGPRGSRRGRGRAPHSQRQGMVKAE
ncbi:hypothetical protein GRJ2_001664600 [Grus japonensis]|uniref:Uncharacterized protein n=1 Tax=Grus japonensis TaxID=30415 RepID=A0ABC9X2U2_GRUJA